MTLGLVGAVLPGVGRITLSGITSSLSETLGCWLPDSRIISSTCNFATRGAGCVWNVNREEFGETFSTTFKGLGCVGS